MSIRIEITAEWDSKTGPAGVDVELRLANGHGALSGLLTGRGLTPRRALENAMTKAVPTLAALLVPVVARVPLLAGPASVPAAPATPAGGDDAKPRVKKSHKRGAGKIAAAAAGDAPAG